MIPDCYINTYPETLPIWQKFYESINKDFWDGIEELKEMIDNFPKSQQVETETC
ncbi:MAG: hypothetical protein QNJ68_08445 [Microcoleaceae cyanobacterium MO_207.B10]|nr:hypothetical protein [Microcoleaceae cyanobacterium MO_207.B10]